MLVHRSTASALMLAAFATMAGCASSDSDGAGSGSADVVAAAAPGAPPAAPPAAAPGASPEGPKVTPPDQVCHTDGCAMRRGAEFQAVVNWMNEVDRDCWTVGSYAHSLVKVSVTDFQLTCGTAEGQEMRTLHVENPELSTDPAKIKVSVAATENVKQPVKDEADCFTDGCVIRKAIEWHSVIHWMLTHDDCTSAVGWSHGLVKKDELNYTATCGDEQPNEIPLRLRQPAETDSKSVDVFRVEDKIADVVER